MLSADHGVGSTPEVTNHAPCARPASDRYQRPCEKAVRLRATDLAAAAEKAVDDALGAGDWVLGVSEPFVVLRPATRARPKADLDKAVAAIQSALAKMPGVARTIDIRSEPADCPPPSDESLDALLCRSVRPSQAEPFGDIFIVAQPGSFIDTGYVEGDGVNHGTPYLFDRAVPLVVRAPREAPAPAAALPRLDAVPVVDQRAYAATVAGLLGISPPSAAKGGADLSREKRAP